MMPERPNLQPACAEAFEALERDPLALSSAVEGHLRRCYACSEARVFLLAMEEIPPVAVPKGYFDGLSFRVLRKLPAHRSGVGRQAATWLAAAALLAALGLGATGFYMGQATHAPMVEAAQPKGVADTLDASAETPFLEAEDPISQLSDLSPKDADSALTHLQAEAESRPDPQGR